MYSSIGAYMSICIVSDMYLCLYISVCVRVCMYMYAYMYI